MKPLSNFEWAGSQSICLLFTLCTALELADKGICVNSINPGVFGTGIHFTGVDPHEYPGMMETKEKMHPLGRCGESNQIVHTIAHLVHEISSFITNSSLLVDSGLSVKDPFS